MKRYFLYSLPALFFSSGAISQSLAPLADAVPTGVRKGIQTVELAGEFDPQNPGPNWMVDLARVMPAPGVPSRLDSLKAAKEEIRRNSPIGVGNDFMGARAVTPQIGTTISGNQMNYGTPPDNTVAISNGGRIVAADNDRVDFFNENGTAVSNSYHDNFFGSLSPYSIVYDPRVIYDPVADRFIYVIMHGYQSSSSKIYLAFSKTNNPSNGWWLYQLSGNPNNGSSWMDYPHIGISNDELFITGNLFTNNFYFDQAVVYQINKNNGYNGQSLTYDVWSNVNNGNAFAIVPASHGLNGTYGPGIYLVSSESGQWNRIYLYQINNNLSNNPQMLVSTITVPTYSPVPNASMLGSSDQLDNGDCRMKDAFYLNGYVHAVHSSDYNNSSYNGVRYYRIKAVPNQTATVESADFGVSGADYSYPSLASFGMADCDQSVMIGFLRATSSIYPEVRVVNCDNDMNWSASTLVTAGTGFVNMQSGQEERWGDYSAMARKHNASAPEVWMSGCYGASSQRWRTAVVEIKGVYEPADSPTAAFNSNTDTAEATAYINYYDNSQGGATSWKWTFENGVPATSTQQNPLVAYTDSGSYNVKLVVRNSAGCADSLEMENYVHIYKLFRDTVIVDGITVYIVGGDSFELFNNTLVPLGQHELASRRDVKIYPNPVTEFELVTLEITTEMGDHITARIYDMQGREIKLLFDDTPKPGRHVMSFNKLALADGTYILDVRNNGQTLHHESIVVRH